MKECPSCNSWLDDEVKQCHCGCVLPEEEKVEQKPDSPAENDFSLEDEETGFSEEPLAGEGTKPEEEVTLETDFGDMDEGAVPTEEPPAEGEPPQETEPPVVAEAGEAEPPALKRCVMCRETIPFDAIRCRHCGSLVSLWEGSIFKEYFYFTFAAIAIFIGCLLPWTYSSGISVVPEMGTEQVNVKLKVPEPVGGGNILEKGTDAQLLGSIDFKASIEGAPIIGYTTFTGVITMFLAFIAVVTCIYNILAKRLVLMPILLAWVESIVVCFLWIFETVIKTESKEYLAEVPQRIVPKLAHYLHLWGSGFYLVCIGVILITFCFVASFFKGGSTKKAERPTPKRGSTAGRRRR